MQSRSDFFQIIFCASAVFLAACTPAKDTAPEDSLTGDVPELRDISELFEDRTSPPYFQLKAGCRLPDMGFEAGYTQLKVSQALAERDMSRIVLKSEQDVGGFGRLGFWEDHTTPESDRIKSLDGLYLVERNLSAIDNRAVREITDSHCNKGAVYGGIVSNIPPNLGPLPDRLLPKAPITHDPRQRFPIDLEPSDPDSPTVDPLFKSLSNRGEGDSYGFIACFELKKVRNMHIVDAEALKPWFNPKDAPICEPIDWDDFKDTEPKILIID